MFVDHHHHCVSDLDFLLGRRVSLVGRQSRAGAWNHDDCSAVVAFVPRIRRWDLAAAWAVFIPLAYIPNFAPERSINLASLTIFWSFFAMTGIILCDQVTMALEHRSLLQESTRSGRPWLSLLCVGALSGLLLDGGAQWLGKLWIYPYWNEAVYGGTFVVGFCAYWLATAESYLAVRAILRRCAGKERVATTPRRYETWLFRALGALGAALILAGVFLLLSDYQHNGGYQFEIRKAVPVRVHFRYFQILFIGIWLALEWVQVARGGASLLKTIFYGCWQPLCALVLAAIGFGAFWETVNASHHFWIYTNWPLCQWRLLSVPGVVLLTWPLQYVVFLSLGFVVGRDLWS